MPWYRFWKKSGPMGGLDKTYRFFDKGTKKDFIKEICGDWAEGMPGGHETHYSYGFKKVKHPPMFWLQNQLVYIERRMDKLRKERGLINSTIAVVEYDCPGN